MADIARLFLDGARGGTGSVPKRVGPAERSAIERERLAAPRPAAAPPAGTWELAPMMLGISGTSGSEGWRLLSAMASGMAHEHSTVVCLLGMQGDQFVLEIAGAESPEDLPRVPVGAGSADMQLARVLFTLRESVGHWMIAAPGAECAAFARLGAAVSQWVLACDANNKGVVAAYQQLKHAVRRATPVLPPRCFMVSDDYAEASLVHGRLRTAAAEFLRQELPLAGVGGREGECCRIAKIRVSDDAGERDRVWTAVIDELCGATVVDDEVEMGESVEASTSARPTDIEAALEQVTLATEAVSVQQQEAAAAFDQLAHVLDPEEREALGTVMEDAEFGSDGADAQVSSHPGVSGQVIPDVRPRAIPPVAEPGPKAEMEERDRGLTLRAFDLSDEEESDRAAQWLAVERSIRDLVGGSIVLEARPPMSWASECCVAIDAAGGLHVWTLYKDGVSWYALREWASEHRQLLALTRRDLAMAREGEVVVHMVLPLETGAAGGKSGPDVKALMRAPSRNVLIYRLRSVQWNGRRGILVVPIA